MRTVTLFWLIRLALLLLGGTLGFFLIRKRPLSLPGKWLSLCTFACPFFSGGYYTAAWVIFGVLAWLGVFHTLRTQKSLTVYMGWGSCALALTVLFYLLSILWAADRGSAILALARYPALLPAAVLWMQTEQDEDILSPLPIAGAVMVLLSLALSLNDTLSRMVAWRGRLCGFFEYANSLALFLTLCFLISGAKAQRKGRDWVTDTVLVLGIFLSGSRTTQLLLLLSAGYLLLVRRNFRTILSLGAGFALSLVISQWNNAQSATRLFTTTAGDSSLLTRLLYFSDALPVILRHPFGLGYMGYRAMQGSFQTGVYSVSYVHNELLQLLLDVGWLPALAMTCALIRSLVRGFGKTETPRKWPRGMGSMCLLVFLGHCMMDFDLQFLSLWLLLLPLLGLRQGRAFSISPRPVACMGGILLLAALYLGTGDTLYDLGQTDLCLKLTPFHSDALADALTEYDTADTTGAEKLLRQNPYSPGACRAMAEAAQSKKDADSMIYWSERAISLAPYEEDGYLSCFDRLITLMNFYRQKGDRERWETCYNALAAIPEKMEKALKDASPLAWKIQHKPSLALDADRKRQLSQAKW